MDFCGEVSIRMDLYNEDSKSSATFNAKSLDYKRLFDAYDQIAFNIPGIN